MSFRTPPSSDDWGLYVDTRTNSTHWLAAPPPERAPLPIGQIVGHAPKQWWERKLEVETFKRVGKARRQLRQRHRRSAEKVAAFGTNHTDLPNTMSHPGPNLSSFEPEWFAECWQECRRAKVMAPRAASRRKPPDTAPLKCVFKAPPTRMPQSIRRIMEAVPPMPPHVTWQSAHEEPFEPEELVEPETEPESEESTCSATPSAGMPRMSAAAPAFTPATTLVPQYTEVYCLVSAPMPQYTEVCYLVPVPMPECSGWEHCCRCNLWGPSQCCVICGSWVCSLHESALDHTCFGLPDTEAAEEAACEIVLLRTMRNLVG
jgi:hypothetical protein